MTVPADDAIAIYTAVGGEANFTYDFPIDVPNPPNSHEIVVQTLSGGLVTTLVENVDYTVTGAGNPGGGLIVLDTTVFPSGAVAGVVWTIFRQIILARPTDFQISGDFFAETVNKEFDKHIRIMQDLKRDLGLSVQLAPGSGLTGVQIPIPGADQYIKWNAAGTALVTATVVTVGAATSVDETDTDATKDKMTSNLLAKLANDTAVVVTGVQVGSAVNKFQATNAATGSKPIIQVVGTDTNIGIDLRTKGTGLIEITGAVSENLSATLVAATTVDISGITGNYLEISGNTTVTGFTGKRAGTPLTVKFTGTPSLTNSANFILESLADIAVPAGSVGRFRSVQLSPAIWQMESWSPSNGIPLVPNILPTGFINGFDHENDTTDATNDIVIGTGSCRDENDTTDIKLNSILIKQIDAPWAVGTNQGGYSSAAALANDTDYHVHVVKELATGVVDVAIDISVTAVNFRASNPGYASRRIGSVRRLTGANRAYAYRAGNCYLSNPASNLSGSISTTGATLTTAVPTGVVVMGRFNFGVACSAVSSSRYGLLTPLLITNPVPAVDLAQVSLTTPSTAGTGTSSTQVDVLTDAARGIRARGNSNTSTTWYVQTLGWFDFRGQG